MFTWGGGGPSFNKGQCGHGDYKDIDQPKPISKFKGARVVDFSCGGYHTIALVAVQEGAPHKIYSWGSGYYGELGTGDVAIS